MEEQIVKELAAAQQSNPTGTTDNSVTNATALPTSESSSSHKTITNEDFEKFKLWLADSKKRNVTDILRDMKGSVNARRQAMILRRVDQKHYAPDEDVAAYQRIYELKNPTGDPKNKTFVSDNEIKAYKELDPRFDSIPSLTAIAAKVEELKAAGQLSAEGDAVEEE